MTAQVQILNKILKTGDFSMVILNNLDESYFFNYQAEFRYIKNHYDTFHITPDRETFGSAFPDFDWINVTEPDNYLIGQLLKDYNASYIAIRFNKVKKLIEDNKIDEAVEYFKKSADEIRPAVAMTCTNLLTDVSRYEHYRDRALGKGQQYIKTGFHELDKEIGGIDPENENMVIAARTGIGKCLEKGTKILMADGTLKAVEDVKIGDKVQSYGRVNTVLDLHNGISNGFKIIPTKGDAFTVSSNHILTLYKYNEIYDRATGKMKVAGGQLVDIMVEDFLKLSKHQKHLYKLFRPAIEYDAKIQLLDPYIFGLWLGDGTSKYAQICTADTEIVEALNKYAQDTNQEVHKLKTSSLAKSQLYSIVGNLQTELRQLNVINNKHIPLEYLTGDRQQRLALLAGLLDTDGSYLKSSHCFDFTQKSKVLFDQVLQLARGLGFRVACQKPKVINNTNYYRCTISGELQEIPTRIKRKQAKKTNHIVSTTNFGFTIEPVDRVEYYGFMCDGDSRYLLADNTLTHNTWTLIKMAVAASQQGLTVGIYSGEMTTDKVGYRFDTLLGGINNKAITRGDPIVMQQYKTYIDTLANNSGLGAIKVLTPADMGGQATVGALRTFVEREKLQILFIDQYSLLEDTSHAKAMWERVGNISKDIKNLQVLTQIPVISVSQMNRTKAEDGGEGKGKQQDTTQIGLSDRIGQDATVVIMLDRDKDMGTLTLNVVKARDGGDGRKFTYKADFNTGEFKYIDENPDDNAAAELAKSYETAVVELPETENTPNIFADFQADFGM